LLKRKRPLLPYNPPMATHTLLPTRETLHGHWSRDLPPTLTIDPGDSVRFATLEAIWCAERRPTKWPWTRVGPYRAGLDDGHALTGPVAVRGARAGMTLAIRIDAIVPDEWAWTFSGPQGERAAALGVAGLPPYATFWDVDPERLIARDPKGREVALRPFMGVMGVAPAEAGVHSTTPPRVWGGNIDCKELVAGTTLFLPIGVDGALFSVGDGHGAQGDGEVCGTAIECPMTRVDLTFDLIDRPLKAPRAKTPDAWITFGFDPDLNRASTMALSGMLDLIEEQTGVNRQEALALASVAADLRVTQIVNQSQGVHAVLRVDAIGGL
jgi:acetamidase/formamidase